MADRTLTKNYLRDAAAEGRTAIADQIAWLEAQRVALSPQLVTGDIFATNVSSDGGVSQFTRDVPTRALIEAILAALEILEAKAGIESSAGKRGALLGIRASDFLP